MREGGYGVCDHLVDILLTGWWWGTWKSASSTFWFQPVWGLEFLGCIGSFFHLVGFQYLQNSSKDMAWNIIYIPWRGTKGPWLYLTVRVLFCLGWLFFFFLHFLTSLIECILWLKFLYRQRQVEVMGGCLFWKGFIGSCWAMGPHISYHVIFTPLGLNFSSVNGTRVPIHWIFCND